jgi:hypothetical protein
MTSPRTLRHTAALALVGWYLMAPPSPASSVPLNHWLMIGSFDSADQCESAKLTLHENLVRTGVIVTPTAEWERDAIGSATRFRFLSPRRYNYTALKPSRLKRTRSSPSRARITASS